MQLIAVFIALLVCLFSVSEKYPQKKKHNTEKYLHKKAQYRSGTKEKSQKY